MQKNGTFCTGDLLRKIFTSKTLVFMVRTSSFLFMAMICAMQILSAAPGYGQGREQKLISLRYTHTPIEKVFNAIEKKADVIIMYEKTAAIKDKKVSISVSDRPVAEVMDLLLKDLSMQWSIRGKFIRIENPTAAFEPVVSSPSAEDTTRRDTALVYPLFTGKVTAADGTPIARATVQVKGTLHGTTTDNEGKFMLEDVKHGAVLLFSSVGYETREIPTTGNSLWVKLNIAVSDLDETVVIAYGTTTKRFNTGNVSTVKGGEIEKQIISNPLQALQGRVAGMTITQNTGVVGGGFNVLIRGRNSITSGNSPMYIVDGVPYSTPDNLLNLGPIVGSGNPLNYLNPSDIESIDILKDADATSIYGSRAANGVILITTKKGTKGETSIDFNVSSGVGNIPKRLNLLNTSQFLEMRRNAFSNSSQQPGPSAYDVNGTWDTTTNTDWQDILFGNNSNYLNSQVSFSGGTQTVSYFISGGYRRETTVFPGNFLDEKGSLRFNVKSVSRNGRFKIELSGNYLVDNSNLFSIDLVSQIYRSPNSPKVYNEDGTINWAPTSTLKATWTNPLSVLLVKYNTNIDNLISNSVISYNIVKGLIAKINLGYTNMAVDEKSKSPINSFDPRYNMTTGNASFNNTSIKSWLIEPQLEYAFQMGEHSINLLGGGTMQSSTSNGRTVDGSGYTNDELLDDIAGATTITSYVTTDNRYRYVAVFGRINYDYKKRYLINLNGRRDGSSRFGPGKRFANFGSAAISWIFTNENFMNSLTDVVSFGKVRASYGITGNDKIGDYSYLSLYYPTYFSYQNSIGLVSNNLFNMNYAWETNKKLELALEFGFFKDKYLITGSYFRNRSSNQLVGYNLPAITGFTNVIANLPAKVQNSGLEFTLDAKIVKTTNLSWTAGFNLTVPRNKLLAYPDLNKSSYSFVVGKPLSVKKVYKYVDVNRETGIYRFQNIHGELTEKPSYTEDRTATVNVDPIYYGGIQTTLGYKEFELSLLLQYVKQTGRNIYFDKGDAPGFSPFSNITKYEYENSWKRKGDIAEFQKFTTAYDDVYEAYLNAGNSTKAYSDASFIRMKNIYLSYNPPEKWRKKIGISSLKFYIQGQNLFTITKYKGLDPETQSASSLPIARMYAAGIQLSL